MNIMIPKISHLTMKSLTAARKDILVNSQICMGITEPHKRKEPTHECVCSLRQKERAAATQWFHYFVYMPINTM